MRTIEPEEWIDREQRIRIDEMGPSRREVEGPDLRTLILACCLRVERVRGLKPRPRQRQIQMESVRVVRLPIEPVERRLRIAVIVNRNEFRRIEKPAARAAV